MSSPVLSFPAADQKQWQQTVVKALRGALPESLNRVDEDGLTIAALYQIDQPHSTAQQEDGVAPVARLTAEPQHRLAYGWRVCQPVEARPDADVKSDPATINRHILDELEGGASGIYLSLNTASLAPLDQMLRSVVLGAADMVIDAGNDAMEVHAALHGYAAQQAMHLADMRVDLSIDPFAPQADDRLLDAGLALLQQADPHHLPDRVFRPNGWQWYDQGMTQVQELAYLLAAATQIFRSGTQAGLTVAEIAQKTALTVALPADMFDGIAKCRALRRGWAGLVTAMGLDAAAYPLHLHAIPALRMFSLADSDVNILRTTTALLGGAIGGADMMTAFAHDALAGSTAKGRRLARMQHLLMIEESGLGRSLDAAGGSAFLEARTEDLAQAAWTAFQAIEAAGGALAAKAAGVFEKTATDAAAARYQRLASGRLPLLGVTVQPDNLPLPPLVPRWQTVQRPAASLEAIRRRAAQAPPRILVLQQATGVDPQRDKMRRLLQVGGMSGVHLSLSSENVDAIVAARAVAVILLDCKEQELHPVVRAALAKGAPPPVLWDAETLLQGGLQIDFLASLVAPEDGAA